MPTYPDAAHSTPSNTLPGASPEHISTLNPDFFNPAIHNVNIVDADTLPQLDVSQIAAIGSELPDQVKVLVASQLAKLLNPELLNALRVEYLSPNNLQPNTNFPLDPFQISLLTPANLNKLTSDQLKKFTKEQIQGITVTQLTKMNAYQISTFTPSQFKFFTVEQVSAFTTFTTSPTTGDAKGDAVLQIQSLTPAQLASLTVPSSGLNNSGVNQVGALRSAQLAVMSREQIQSFTPSTPVNQVAELNIEGMGGEKFALLTNAQISALTSRQVSSLESTYSTYFTYLSYTQIPAFTNDKILLWGKNITSVIDSSQLQALTQAQIQAPFAPTNIEYLYSNDGNRNVKFSPQQMSWLSPSQIAGFLPQQISTWTSQMTNVIKASQLALLVAPTDNLKIKAFNVQHFNTASPFPFNAPQISTMSDSQIPNIQNDHIYGLLMADVRAITPSQFSVLTATQMKHWSNDNVGYFTLEQIKALNTEADGSDKHAKRKLLFNLFVSQFWLFSDTVKAYLRNVNDDGGNAILDQGSNEYSASMDGTYADKNTTAVQTMSSSSGQAIRLTYLHADQLQFLINAQITTILAIGSPLSTLFSRDNLKQFNKNILTLDSANDLTTNSINSSYPSLAQLSALTPAVLRNVSFCASLTASQINALAAEQLLSLNPVLIPTTEISGLTTDTLLKFTKVFLEGMSVDQIRSFSQAQLQNAAFVALIASSPTVSNALTPIPGNDGGQIDYIPAGRNKTKIIESRSVPIPMNLQIDLFSTRITDTTPLIPYAGDELSPHTAIVGLDMLTSNLRNFITYKIFGESTSLGQGEIRFFVDASKFVPKDVKYGTTYDTIKWGDLNVKNTTNVKWQTDKHGTAVDFMKYVLACKYPDIPDVSPLYWNDHDVKKTSFTSSLENGVHTQHKKVIDPVSINSASPLLTDSETGKKYTILSDSEVYGEILNLPSEVYMYFMTQQPSRILQNHANAGGIYNMPFITGDKIQFTYTIVAHNSHVYNGVVPSKTYLVEITAVDA